jgi:hypothetical protein
MKAHTAFLSRRYEALIPKDTVVVDACPLSRPNNVLTYVDLPQSPQSTWLGGRYLPASRSRMVILTTNRGMGDNADSRPRQNTSAPADTGRWPRISNMVPIPRRFRRNGATNDASAPNPTPGQLEAATR